jgi:hypothetical protein
MAASMVDVDSITSGDAVGVVVPEGSDAVPVLSTVARLPPLLPDVLHATADTMVKALRDADAAPGRGATQALCAAASGLWYLYGDAAAEAVEARCKLGESGDAVAGSLLVSLVMRTAPGTPVPGLAQVLGNQDGDGGGSAAAPEATVLYANPSEFACMTTAIAPLQQLSSEFEVVAAAGPATAAGPGGLPTLYMFGRQSAAPMLALVPGAQTADSFGYSVTKVSKQDLALVASGDLVYSPSLLAPVTWVLSFGREDLLAIALSGADAIAAFVALANLHTGCLTGMCARATTATIQVVVAAMQRCNISPARKSRHVAAVREAGAAALAALCAMLPPGIAAQLVLDFTALQPAEAYLQDLDKSVFVCVAEDKATGNVYMGPATEASNTSGSAASAGAASAAAAVPHMVFTHRLHTDTGKVAPLHTSLKRRWDQVAAWSEAAPLRGVAVGAVTLALAAALGSEHVRESLSVIADLACAPVNDQALFEQATRSSVRIRASLQQPQP